MRKSFLTVATLLLSCAARCSTAAGQEAAPQPVVLDARAGELPSTASNAELTGPEGLIRLLLLEHLPRTYENAKKWGLTKPRWNGVSVSRDGLNIKTKRKWKEVNHGTWSRYQAWLIDPEKQLTIHFGELRPSGTHRVAFDLTVEARVGANGRLAEWNHGIQLYSFGAEADGKIRMRMTCDLGWKMDVTNFPPDLVLDPRVTQANVELQEFHLHRLSDIDGSLAGKLGNELRDDLEREINERQAKMVEKINRAIDKRRDKLRLSAHDLVSSGWSRLLGSDQTPSPAISPASTSGNGQSPRSVRREE